MKQSIITVLICALLFSSCSSSKSYFFSTKDGIDLKIEIDYKFSELNKLENRCPFNYIVTNMSNKAFDPKEPYDTIMYNNKIRLNRLTLIDFEFLTNDRKKIKISKGLPKLEAGYSSPSKRVWATSVGKNRRCIAIEPTRIRYQ